MFRLGPEQGVKFGQVAMEEKDIPDSMNRMYSDALCKKIPFPTILPWHGLLLSHQSSWFSSNRHSLLRAFTFAWNALPSDICKAGFLISFKSFSNFIFSEECNRLPYFKLLFSHSLSPCSVLFFSTAFITTCLLPISCVYTLPTRAEDRYISSSPVSAHISNEINICW